MKPTNRKIWLTVAIVAAIVLIADFILLLAFGAISGTVFGITALISGPLAIIPMMFLIAPDEMKKQWNNADIARQGFLPRTKEATLFEVASAFILIASWGVAIAPPNEEIYIICIVTFCVIALLISAYFTNKWTFGMIASDNMQQLQTRARFKRIIAVETALYGLLTVIPEINQTFVNWTFLLLAILSLIWFFTAHFKSKRS
jgi:hypothetical protein